MLKLLFVSIFLFFASVSNAEKLELPSLNLTAKEAEYFSGVMHDRCSFPEKYDTCHKEYDQFYCKNQHRSLVFYLACSKNIRKKSKQASDWLMVLDSRECNSDYQSNACELKKLKHYCQYRYDVYNKFMCSKSLRSVLEWEIFQLEPYRRVCNKTKNSKDCDLVETLEWCSAGTSRGQNACAGGEQEAIEHQVKQMYSHLSKVAARIKNAVSAGLIPASIGYADMPEVVKKSQLAWNNYKEQECILASTDSAGGTLQAASYSLCSTNLAKERLHKLRNYVRDNERLLDYVTGRN